MASGQRRFRVTEKQLATLMIERNPDAPQKVWPHGAGQGQAGVTVETMLYHYTTLLKWQVSRSRCLGPGECLHSFIKMASQTTTKEE